MRNQQESNRKAEIGQLKTYRRQGVHSAFTGMHYRFLQRKYPTAWDVLAFEEDKEDRRRGGGAP